MTCVQAHPCRRYKQSVQEHVRNNGRWKTPRSSLLRHWHANVTILLQTKWQKCLAVKATSSASWPIYLLTDAIAGHNTVPRGQKTLSPTERYRDLCMIMKTKSFHQRSTFNEAVQLDASAAYLKLLLYTALMSQDLREIRRFQDLSRASKMTILPGIARKSLTPCTGGPPLTSISSTADQGAHPLVHPNSTKVLYETDSEAFEEVW